MTIDATRRAIIAIPGITMLGGCALLSSPDPVPLFRFGQLAVTDRIDPIKTSAVLFTGVTFPRLAGGDRILTVEGAEVSYIAGGRWAAPAVGLFDEAVVRAFDSSSVRLYRRGTTARADATLRVEVQAFEARYLSYEAAPAVYIDARALLTPAAPGGATSEWRLGVSETCTTNRVSAIADAFNEATAVLLMNLVGWTRANVQPAAPSA